MTTSLKATPPQSPVPATKGILGLSALQWLALVVILVAAGSGGFWGLSKLLSDESASASGQPFAVRRGDITDAVSTNGAVAYSTRETLRFSAPGTVGEVLVAAGDTVAVGDPIATLDAPSQTSLDRAVKEAEVAVDTAQQRVTDLSKPANSLLLAQAAAEVTSATAALADARRATDAALRRAVVEAQDAVSKAQARADALVQGLAVAEAQVVVTQARAALRTAEDALASFTDGTEKARAGDTLTTASATLSNAVADLTNVEAAQAEKVKAALTAVTDAETKYKDAFRVWTSVTLSAAQIDQEPSAVLATLGGTYDTLAAIATSDNSALTDDPATPWNESVLFVLGHLVPAALTGSCSATTSSSMRCIQRDLETPWKAITTARTAYDSSISAQTAAVSGAKNAIAKSEDSMAAAQIAYDEAAAGTASAARSANVVVAKASLAEAESKFASAALPDAPAIVTANAVLEEAKSKLATASDALLNGDDTQISNVALSVGRLDSAQEKLADLQTTGSDVLSLALARAQATEAKARLDSVRATLAGATVRATFAGVVSAVGVKPGQSVSAATDVVEIIDPGALEVQGTVDEIDVLSVTVGAAAVISMDALGTRTLGGTVSEISGTASNQNGVVSYPIKVRITVPLGLQLREGLSATANVTVRSETNAILVPVTAIGGSFSNYPKTVLVNSVVG